ncbi:MAG: phosphatidate cytidylyltransferase, partial [Acidimicrobiales bacterium]
MGEDRTAPRTGRVRIVGAEPAGEVEPPPPGEPGDPGAPEEAPGPGGDGVPGMAHWTEAPTGQVPAVLSGPAGPEDDPWASLPEPTWREEHTDWAAHEEVFDPSMLAAGDAVGADEEDDERRPWSFDLPGSPEPVDPLAQTMAVPVVAGGDQPEEVGERPPAGPGDAAGDPDDVPVPKAGTRGGAGGALTPSHAAAGDPYGDLYGDLGILDTAGTPAVPAPDLPGPGDLGTPAVGPPVTTPGPGTPGPDLPGPDFPVPGARRAPSTKRRAAAGGGPANSADRADGGGRNLPLAVASGLVVGAVVLVCFAFGSVSAVAVATVVIGLAAVEGFAAFRKAGYHPATLLGLAAVVGVMIAAYDKGEAAEPLVLVLLVAATLVWHLARVDRAADPVRSTVATVFVYCWVGVFGSYAALLLSPANFPHRHGIAYLLGAVITVVAYDVGSLAVGRWIGHRPLTP